MRRGRVLFHLVAMRSSAIIIESKWNTDSKGFLDSNDDQVGWLTSTAHDGCG